MRRLVLSLAVILMLLLGANYGARLYAQQRVASRLASTLGTSQPTVRIGGFPFLWNLLADGTVRSVSLHLGPTGSGSLRVAAVNATVEGVRVRTASLFQGGVVKVLSAGPADIRAVLTAEQISAAMGRPIRLLADGDATVSLFGRTLTLHPSITSGGGVALGIPGFPSVHMPLPNAFHLGGCAPTLRISSGQAVLGCHFQTVPQAILRRA